MIPRPTCTFSDLEVIRFASSANGDYRSAVIGNAIAVNYPELSKDGVATQAVFDGDFRLSALDLDPNERIRIFPEMETR